uniref:Nardilysin convertase n=1 Tax=Hucho hucho TaxID=62062 RepID=A0A4W5JCP0_9TELE
ISDFTGPASSGDDESEEEEELGEEEEDPGEGAEEESEEEEDDSDFEDDEDGGKRKKGHSEKQVRGSNSNKGIDDCVFVYVCVYVCVCQSAAALCVGIGSFSDPNDLPGLAHFLEHMVFMGSEKYPSENGFDAFLKKHGGSDNASTDCERTVFQFDVQRKKFREALDRWAQFFICPLMIRDAIDREVEAVDSEYQLAKPSDSHRKEMLFGSLAKPGHPMGKFCWGNAQTLKTEPRKKKINVYKRLRSFWKRHYSAHYMTLAVQSKEKLDTLEEWVREIFSGVPNNAQPKPDFSELLDPFDTPAFNKLYRVVPVRKVHALTITWSLPPQEKHYSAALSLLTPDRSNLLLLSPDHEGHCPLREKWFGTHYSVEYIQQEWRERWNGDFEHNSDLHLPVENKFIATDFSLKLSDCPDTELPVRVTANDRGCLWYKKDSKFNIPKAYICFHLISPVIQQSAKKYVQGLVSHYKLQFSKLPAKVPVLFRVVELPLKQHLCKVKALNKGDANSEVTVYYQSGPKNLREHTLMELLVMHMEEPCFDFLRTKETLGYHVYPTCRNTSGVLGFSVTVETQATKFNTELVELKIEEFLSSFGEKFSALTESAFNTQVTALVKLKECEDTHLGEEVDRNWAEVATQQYVFNRLHREIEALKQMTRAELVSWYLEHRGHNCRKLSVHVVGFGPEEGDPPGDDHLSYGEVSKLTFLPASPKMAAATSIMDIPSFTQSLTLFPYHKIIQ